jgi:ribosomal protein S25
LGVKGFDGKYYVVRADVYEETLEKIKEATGEEGATVDEIAAKTGLEKGLVRAVLEIAREDGIFYELRGGRYAYAG